MKILFLQKRILFPPDTGGKIRTLNILRHLARWHQVTYLCNVQPEDESRLAEMQALGLRLETIPWRETPRDSWKFFAALARNLLSPYPFNVAKDFDPALRARAVELLAEEDYDLVICDFVQMARNALGLDVRAKLLFEHNVEAEIFHRHATTGPGWLRRRFMGYQWRKMRRFEADAGRQFDTVIAVSDRDRQMFQDEYGWRHVKTIDTAVDLEYFQPTSDRETEGRVVFLGSMDWLPNQDGVRTFVEQIWPRIHRARPDATFQIVGRNPSADVKKLGSSPGVQVVGTVPDVRPYLDEAAVVVVPLWVGGGTRIKIFEAMAMQKAVVSTSLGAEGLPVASGENVILADEAEEFAKAVVSLLNDGGQRSRMAAAARELVCRRFSAETVARQFESICRETVEDARTQPAPQQVSLDV